MLNFSRAILLREVMRRHGDQNAALFAGNWGWNSLPAEWQGEPSIWGQVDAQTQARYTISALERARREWPWMGYMFLESWDPDVAAGDPRHGFDIANRPVAQALAAYTPAPDVAFSGFHLAQDSAPAQHFEGGWRFSPEYGADISETGDTATLHFWGTDVGLRVRRADYRARFYVTVDGQEVNALPDDGNGTALVLTSPASNEDYLSTELVARDLSPGPHTLTVTAYRGWDQWALNGFSVGYQPPATNYWISTFALSLLGVLSLLLALYSARRVAWGPVGQRWQAVYERSSEQARLLVTVLAAGLVALTGWLTWGEQAAGLYRRLGDVGQLAATAAAASLFYVTPYFFLYLAALVVLFFLIYARPAWGLALVAFSFPFYVVPKPLLGYRFSPVEIFILLSTVAFIASQLSSLVTSVKAAMKEQELSRLQATHRTLAQSWHRLRSWPIRADAAVLTLVAVATLSLLFTERLDVATNEWRVVIIEPALFYFLFRALRPSRDELWTILDAFVLGGLTVALYGLWQFAQGENVITVAGGVSRLRSVYGSPNNVALYLGRIFPFLFAMLLAGRATPRRRIVYALILIPVAVATLMTLSKGALFLGIPAAAAVVFLLWLREQGRALWPWLLAGAVVAIAGLAVVLNVPALSERLNLQGATSLQRLNLWRASLTMFAENPVTGVGLDNFLYEYRGRYILDAAWEEPDLNHPHNIVLDFATRLGLLGLIAGAWLFWELAQRLRRLPFAVSGPWKPVAFGLCGALAQTLAHGLVDHSFFLVDLAFAFYLLLATAIWLQRAKS
jgi:O-antigen ligase